MTKELNVNEVVERARRAQESRLSVIKGLAEAQQNVTNVRAEAAERIAKIEQETSALIAAAEREHVSEFQGAQRAGWSADELKAWVSQNQIKRHEHAGAPPVNLPRRQFNEPQMQLHVSQQRYTPGNLPLPPDHLWTAKDIPPVFSRPHVDSGTQTTNRTQDRTLRFHGSLTTGERDMCTVSGTRLTRHLKNPSAGQQSKTAAPPNGVLVPTI